MKIALFHNIPTGGAKRVVYEEVKYFSKKNRVDLYTYTSNAELVWNLEPFVKKVYRFDFDLDHKTPKYFKRLINDFKVLFRLKSINKYIANIIDSKNYDIVLIHPDVLFETPFLFRYLKTPSIYYCHEYFRQVYEPELHSMEGIAKYKVIYEEIIRYLRKIIDKKNVSYIKNIISSSSFVKRNIKRVYKKDSIIISPGVDSNVFKKINVKKENVLLFTGDPNFIKGYDFALKILRKLNGNFKLKVLKTQGVMDIRNDYKMACEYSKSFFTLCLGRKEPFGLSALESMACETCVLAVDEGGYKDTIINGETGFLLERNVSVFVNNIKYLLNNQKILKGIERNGRIHVKNNYSWNIHNKNIENLIHQIVG